MGPSISTNPSQVGKASFLSVGFSDFSPATSTFFGFQGGMLLDKLTRSKLEAICSEQSHGDTKKGPRITMESLCWSQESGGHVFPRSDHSRVYEESELV